MALKQQGSATIAQLADLLQLTGEAVRQQLLQLQRDGWIEAHIDRAQAEKARTGRPATMYTLTSAGDHLFPKQYDEFNVSMIDAIADELGPAALMKVFERMSDARVAGVEPTLRGKPLEEKVALLQGWYLDGDPYMEVERGANGDFYLRERNCPFLNTAMRRPALCGVSVNSLTRLLGVRVQRDEKFQTGHGRCVFHVFANEPIDPETFEYRAELPL